MNAPINCPNPGEELRKLRQRKGSFLSINSNDSYSSTSSSISDNESIASISSPDTSSEGSPNNEIRNRTIRTTRTRREGRGVFLRYETSVVLNPRTYKYTSLVELMELADPSEILQNKSVELCLDNSTGKMILVEEANVTRFYRMVWKFVTDPNREEVLGCIKQMAGLKTSRDFLSEVKKELRLSPALFVKHYGGRTIFREEELANLQWSDFKRILPNWNFPCYRYEGSMTYSDYFYITSGKSQKVVQRG